MQLQGYDTRRSHCCRIIIGKINHLLSVEIMPNPLAFGTDHHVVPVVKPEQLLEGGFVNQHAVDGLLAVL